jgi:hypothetical protein
MEYNGVLPFQYAVSLGPSSGNELRYNVACAIAQAVSRRLPTAGGPGQVRLDLW